MIKILSLVLLLTTVSVNAQVIEHDPNTYARAVAISETEYSFWPETLKQELLPLDIATTVCDAYLSKYKKDYQVMYERLNIKQEMINVSNSVWHYGNRKPEDKAFFCQIDLLIQNPSLYFQHYQTKFMGKETLVSYLMNLNTDKTAVLYGPVSFCSTDQAIGYCSDVVTLNVR